MNADITRTREFYRTVPAEDLCSCSYCKNYYRQIRSAYPELAAYLAALGADIEKPLETSPLEPDDRGMLEYCACQYILYGYCPENFHHHIGNVECRVTASHPRLRLNEDFFVLEFFPIRLPWQPDT